MVSHTSPTSEGPSFGRYGDEVPDIAVDITVHGQLTISIRRFARKLRWPAVIAGLCAALFYTPQLDIEFRSPGPDPALTQVQEQQFADATNSELVPHYGLSWLSDSVSKGKYAQAAQVLAEPAGLPPADQKKARAKAIAHARDEVLKDLRSAVGTFPANAPVSFWFPS